MSAWGISWGGSYGNSWGPLHEVEEVRSTVYGSGVGFKGKGKARFYSPEPEDLSTLHQDDMVAVDLLIALVLKGFFNGKHI